MLHLDSIQNGIRLGFPDVHVGAPTHCLITDVFGYPESARCRAPNGAAFSQGVHEHALTILHSTFQRLDASLNFLARGGAQALFGKAPSDVQSVHPDSVQA